MIYLLEKIKIVVITLVFAVLLLSSAVSSDFPDGVNDEAPLELTLMDAIELAVNNDLGLKEAGKDVEIARALLKQAKSGLYPSLSAQATYSRIHPAPGIEIGQISKSLIDEDQHDVTFSFQYLISDGGGISNLRAQAEANLDIYLINERNVKQEVIYKTSQAYLNCLKGKALLRVAEQAVELSKEQLELSQKKYDAGTVAKADVLRAQANLADGETLLIDARNGYALSIKVLNDAMGISLDREVNFSGDYSYQDWNITLEETRIFARDNRLELDIMRKSRESAYYAIGFSKSSWYPDLFFKLDYTAWGNGLLTDTNTVVASVGAQFNIFDGFKTGGEVEEAEANYEKVSIELENVKNKINLDATTAYMNLEASSEKVFKAEENVKAANESYRVAQISYREGVSPFVDVSQAQMILTNAEVSQVQALYDYYLSKIELLRAMGLLEELGKDGWK